MMEEQMDIKKVGAKSRTLEVEILRLWCTIAVCLHHLRYCSESLPYGGGYIAVDFFFMVSGFYLRQSYVEKKGGNMGTVEFIKKRYFRLYKDYIISFGIALLVSLSILGMELGGNISWYIREAFMLEVGNIESGLRINPPGWYCGYLLLASVIVYIFQKKTKRWVGSLSLSVGVIIYILLAVIKGHLCIFPLSEGINWLAVLRAIAGLLIGFFIFEIYKNKSSIKGSKLILKIIYFLGITIISYMLFWNTAFSITDYIVLPIFAILIFVSQFIEIKCLSKIDDKIWKTLSQMIYIAFLNHYVIVKLIGFYNVMNFMDWKLLSILYITTILGVSYLLLLVRRWLERLVYKISGNRRRCFNGRQ